MFLEDDFHHNGAFRLSYGFEYSYLVENDTLHFHLMQIRLFTLIACITTLDIIAQPYVDPLQIRYTNAFHHNNATPFTHLYIGSDLPFKMKRNRVIVLS